jgi:hypothetical protein
MPAEQGSLQRPDLVQLAVQFLVTGHQIVPHPLFMPASHGAQAGACAKHGGDGDDDVDQQENDPGEQLDPPPSGDVLAAPAGYPAACHLPSTLRLGAGACTWPVLGIDKVLVTRIPDEFRLKVGKDPPYVVLNALVIT